MSYSEFAFLVKSDLHRYAGDSKLSSFMYHIALSPGYTYSFWMRLCSYLRSHKIFRYIFPVAWLILRHYEYKYGISISHQTKIGSGLHIGHTGGIVVNQHVVIGKNCNISHQVTIGRSNRGTKKGCPLIGDNVYIGPGAKVFGNIHIGNNVAVGANCVVTKDIPDHSVVVGIPGRVISSQGSAGYINSTDYAPKMGDHS